MAIRVLVNWRGESDWDDVGHTLSAPHNLYIEHTGGTLTSENILYGSAGYGQIPMNIKPFFSTFSPEYFLEGMHTGTLLARAKPDPSPTGARFLATLGGTYQAGLTKLVAIRKIAGVIYANFFVTLASPNYIDVDPGDTEWHTFGVSWSDGAVDTRLRGFLDGAQQGADQTTLAITNAQRVALQESLCRVSDSTSATSWGNSISDLVVGYVEAGTADIYTVSAALNARTLTVSALDSAFGSDQWDWWQLRTINDISADVKGCRWNLGFRAPYQLVADESQATITLDNSSGRYNPENPSSPLYPHIKPYRRVKIQEVAAGTATLWTGWVEVPQTPWKPAGAQTGQIDAIMTGIGAKSLLQDIDMALPMYADVTGDVIIGDVLAQAQIPPAVSGGWLLEDRLFSILGETTFLASAADYSDLETGVLTLSQYGDIGEPDAYRVIKEVTEAERGRFFFDRDGKAIWWNRQHFLIDVAVDGTVNTASGDYQPVGMDYAYGRDLANIVRIRAHPRKTGGSETLWELNAPITLAGGETVRFEVRLRKSTGQFVGASTLIETPTFSSGSGSVTAEEKGGKAEVTVINNSATLPAVLSALTLSGAPTTNQSQMEITEVDTASIGQYGKRELSINLGAVEDYADAQDVAAFEIARRKTPRGNVGWLKWLRQWNGVDNAHMLNWGVGTRLTVTANELGHSADYFIIEEDHSWGPGMGGGIHQATFRLEPATSITFWMLGETGYSELDETTVLAY